MNLAPRFIALPPLLIVGMREPLTEQNSQTIPQLWKKFSPYIGNIPHQKEKRVAYGLCVRNAESSNGSYYYMAGCEVNDFADLPGILSPLIVPAHQYAVFVHETPAARIKETIDQVFDQWLPSSGFIHHAQSIHFFERYSELYNPETGMGGTEVWLPIV
jgi:AraC family transcriptional regulator